MLSALRVFSYFIPTASSDLLALVYKANEIRKGEAICPKSKYWQMEELAA